MDQLGEEGFASSLERENSGCDVHWGLLPNEMVDAIFQAATLGDAGTVCAVIIPFVCRQWRDRKPLSHLLSQKQRSSSTVSKMAVTEAAGHGWMELLRWLRAQGCPIESAAVENAAKAAARGGHQEVVEWLMQLSTKSFSFPFACKGAARGGRLDLLKWLIEEEEKALTETTPKHNASDILKAAARGGSMEIVMWFVEERKGAFYGQSMTLKAAARGGHLDMMKYFMNEKKWSGSDGATCAAAARGGHLEVLRLLREFGVPWDERTCTRAAMGGHLGVLKWARENGCKWNEGVCASAARGGHLEVLKWAREGACEWDATTTYHAAVGGHVSVLKWALEKGCPWHNSLVLKAAIEGRLKVLQWVSTYKDAGFWNLRSCLVAASSHGYLEMVVWAREAGSEWHDRMCQWAASGGHLGVLKWAREQGCPWSKEACLKEATLHNRPHVVQWILSQQQDQTT